MILCLLSLLSAHAGQTVGLPSENGKVVFEEKCSACHSFNAFYSEKKSNHLVIPINLEQNKLTQSILKRMVRVGAPNMLPFRKTEISDEQLQELISYLLNKN